MYKIPDEMKKADGNTISPLANDVAPKKICNILKHWRNFGGAGGLGEYIFYQRIHFWQLGFKRGN
jgi:hypothetical protein